MVWELLEGWGSISKIQDIVSDSIDVLPRVP